MHGLHANGGQIGRPRDGNGRIDRSGAPPGDRCRAHRERRRAPSGRRGALLAGAGIVAAFLAWVYLWPWPRYIPILTYHSVVPRAEMDRINTAVISAERFAEQMRFLVARGYRTVTASQLEAFVTGRPVSLPRRPIVITFDDGYLDNYVVARPILRSVGYTALVAVIVRSTDEATAGRAVEPGLRYLTWDQVLEMAGEGTFEVESHTYDSHRDVAIDGTGTAAPAMTHRRFLWDEGRLETEAEYRARIAADLARAKDEITRRVGREPLIITYPYGTSNSTVEGLALATGYRLGLTTLRGLNLRGVDPMRLRRITVLERDTPLRFALKLDPMRYPAQLLLDFLRRRGLMRGD